MGWLNPVERKAVKKKYKVRAYYICDHCKLPILDAPLVDPKGGYHPWPKRMAREARTLMSRDPKITYHTKPCGIELFSKSGRKQKLYEDVTKAADRILIRLKKRKSKGYWTKERLQKHYKDTFDKKIFKKAMSLLRKEKKIRKRKGGYVATH
jgi:hypothetical protein